MNSQQETALALIVRNMKASHHHFLHAGQRSGSQEIVKEYINGHSKHKQISVMSTSYLAATDFAQGWDRYGDSVLINRMPTAPGSSALVVIHEALWQHLAWGIFLMGRHRCHDILVVSTNGPERDDGVDFMELETRMSYPTKTLNPAFDIEHQRTLFVSQRQFDRDYMDY